MAVDQDAVAEALLGLRHQAAQRLVVGPVVAADALQPFLQAQLAAVDAGAVGYHPGDGAEAGGDARRRGVGVGRQPVPEHRRVELVGLPVRVDEGAREEGVQQGGAHLRRSEEHTSELQSLMRISYDVFCLKKKKIITTYRNQIT